MIPTGIRRLCLAEYSRNSPFAPSNIKIAVLVRTICGRLDSKLPV